MLQAACLTLAPPHPHTQANPSSSCDATQLAGMASIDAEMSTPRVEGSKSPKKTVLQITQKEYQTCIKELQRLNAALPFSGALLAGRKHSKSYADTETHLRDEDMEIICSLLVGEDLHQPIEILPLQFKTSEVVINTTFANRQQLVARIVSLYNQANLNQKFLNRLQSEDTAVVRRSSEGASKPSEHQNMPRAKAEAQHQPSKYRGQSDKRKPIEFVEAMRNYFRYDLQINLNSEIGQRRLIGALRNNLEDNIQEQVQTNWDLWVSGLEEHEKESWPTEAQMLQWIESTRTETFQTADIRKEWLSLENKSPTVNSLVKYTMLFRRSLHKLATAKRKPNAYDVKWQYFEKLHASIKSKCSKYGEDDRLGDDTETVEAYIDAIQSKITSKKATLALSTENAEPKTPGFNRSQKKAVINLIKENIKGLKPDETIAAIGKGPKGAGSFKGGGKFGRKGGKGEKGGGKGEGKGLKRKRCPRCNHPFHSRLEDCFYSDKYSGDKRPADWKMPSEEAMKQVKEKFAKIESK
jgi:hypothetical protein